LDLIALTMLGVAIRRGEPWAIQKHIGQRMWTADRGGWRPGGMKLGITAESPVTEKDNGAPPLQLIVQFEKGDPKLKPVL
jgi:hypothetical protein